MITTWRSGARVGYKKALSPALSPFLYCQQLSRLTGKSVISSMGSIVARSFTCVARTTDPNDERRKVRDVSSSVPADLSDLSSRLTSAGGYAKSLPTRAWW